MRFRNKAIKKGLRKWRNYMKDARAGNIAEEEHNELYLQKLLLKHFNTWVLFYFTSKFNKLSRKLLMKRL